jgi:hypothetical protein
VPAFAPNGAETRPYSLEEIAAMLKILSEPSPTAVATAAFIGLRLGELRGLVWESFAPAVDEESLGWLNVTQSVWGTSVGDPKTECGKLGTFRCAILGLSHKCYWVYRKDHAWPKCAGHVSSKPDWLGTV